MTDTIITLLAVGAGVLAVPLTSLFKNRNWSNKVKALVSFVVSALASLGVTIPIDITNAADVHAGYVTAVVFTVSQLLYKGTGFENTRANEQLTNSLVKPKNAK